MKAVLFDLDGTLLPMDNDEFTKCYMLLLGKKFAELGYDAQQAVKGVWNGLRQMVMNQGEQTNEEAFWEGFLTVMGTEMLHSIEDLNELLISFYEHEFQQASTATTPSSIAKKLIDEARNAGCRIILATNPIFPKVAVLQRLSWIGLTASDFDDITTYETSHFCKPNPSYYTEILERNNLQAEDCLMVGNDVKEDILPAASLGIKTYLAIDHQIGDAAEATADRCGLLAELFSIA